MKPKKASLASQARSVPVVLVVSCLLITLCSYLLKRSEATTYLGDRAHAIFRLANTGRRPPSSRIGDAAWASLTLAHNLSSPPSATLQLFYEQQVLALLSHTELINWAWSRARDRFCRCTWRTPSPQVALVGNGPISAEQREEISRMSCIVRFNRVESRRPGERTDLWMVRGMGDGSAWQAPGFANGSRADEGDVTLELARETSGIALVYNFVRNANGLSWAGVSGRVGTSYPWLPAVAAFADAAGFEAKKGEAKLLPLDLGPMIAAWNSVTSKLGYRRSSLPSSGLIGVLAALECLPLDGSLHLYGFNWSPGNLEVHIMPVEASFIAVLGLLYPGRVVVHPTPCEDYRGSC